MAHDLIHMILTQLHCADWSKSVSFSACIGRAEWGMVPRCGGTEVIATTGRVGTKTKRPGLGLSHKALSRSPPPELLNRRLEPSRPCVNGTGVPDDITLRPYREGSLRS